VVRTRIATSRASPRLTNVAASETYSMPRILAAHPVHHHTVRTLPTVGAEFERQADLLY
jgi:hypothetical protein